MAGSLFGSSPISTGPTLATSGASLGGGDYIVATGGASAMWAALVVAVALTAVIVWAVA